MKKILLTLLLLFVLSPLSYAGTGIYGWYDYWAPTKLNPKHIPANYVNNLVTFNGLISLTSPYYGFNNGTIGAPTTDTVAFFTWTGWTPSGYLSTPGNTNNVWRALRDTMHAHSGKIIVEFHCEVGSQSMKNFDTLILDTNKCKTFATSVTAFMQRWGADGISFNLEYPMNSTASRNGIDYLFKQLKADWAGGIYGLTLVKWAYFSYSNAFSVPPVGTPGATQILAGTYTNYLTFLALEGYNDFATNKLTHNAAIYNAYGTPNQTGGYSQWAAAGQPEVYEDRFLNEWGRFLGDSSKLVAMVPFEQRRFSYSGTPSIGATGTMVTYADNEEVTNFLTANPNSYSFDAVAQVPWCAAGGIYYTHEDSISLYYKTYYTLVKYKALGMGIWSLVRGTHVGATGYAGTYSSSGKSTVTTSLTLDQQQPQAKWLYQNVQLIAGGGTAPNAPVLPTLTSPANNATNVSITPTLTVSTGQYDTTYTYQILLNGAVIITQPGVATTSWQVPLNTLTYNTTYTWQVSGNTVYTGLTSGYTAPFTFTTASNTTLIPNKPILVYPAYGATGLLPYPDTLKWNRAANAVTYLVKIYTDTTQNPFLFQSGLTDTTFVNSAVPLPSGLIFWQVKAVNSNGDSGYTSNFKFSVTSAVTPSNSLINSLYQTMTGSDGRVRKILNNAIPFQLAGNINQVLTPDTNGASIYLLQGTSTMGLMLHDRSTYNLGGSGGTQSPFTALTNQSNIFTSPQTIAINSTSNGLSVINNGNGNGAVYTTLGTGNAFTASAYYGVGAFVQAVNGDPFQAWNLYQIVTRIDTGGLIYPSKGIKFPDNTILTSASGFTNPVRKAVQDSLNTGADTLNKTLYLPNTDTLKFYWNTTDVGEIFAHNTFLELRNKSNSGMLFDDTQNSETFTWGGTRGFDVGLAASKGFRVLSIGNYATEKDSVFEFSDSTKHPLFMIGSRGPISVKDSVASGVHSFTTTSQEDTATVIGGLTTDTYVVSAKFQSGITATDILSWEPLAGAVHVHRLANGVSGLTYSWIRVRRK